MSLICRIGLQEGPMAGACMGRAGGSECGSVSYLLDMVMDAWDVLRGGNNNENNNNDSNNGQRQASEKEKDYFTMYGRQRVVVAAGVCASPCKTLNSVMRGSAGTQPAYLLALLLCFDRPDVGVCTRCAQGQLASCQRAGSGRWVAVKLLTTAALLVLAGAASVARWRAA